MTNGTGTYKIQMGLRKKEELTAEIIGKGGDFNEVESLDLKDKVSVEIGSLD